MSNIPPLLMIVDDSRTSRMLIRAMTAQLRPDWCIVEASSGDESLEKIAAEIPDFVTIDVNMSGMRGLEAAGRIRLKYSDSYLSGAFPC